MTLLNSGKSAFNTSPSTTITLLLLLTCSRKRFCNLADPSQQQLQPYTYPPRNELRKPKPAPASNTTSE